MSEQVLYRSPVYITAPAERVWEGITQPELTRQWYFGTSVVSTWEVGSSVVYQREGTPLFEGTVLDIAPPHLLVTTFSALFHPQARHDQPCRLTWRITPIDEDIILTIAFEDIDEGSATAMLVKDRLAYQLQVLKAVLETGRRPPIGNVTFDCAEPPRLAEFWQQVTGYVIDGMGQDWAGLHDPRGIGPRLLFLRVPEPKTVKNRVHLDIRVSDRQAEVARLVAVGGRHLRMVSEGGQGWEVMADPEGNEFCIA